MSVKDLRTDATPGVRFQDGLGTRIVRVDAASGDTLEVHFLCPELSAYERSIKDRTSRLTSFRHARFAAVRSVDMAESEHGKIGIVYDHVIGPRLSELLDGAARRQLVVDANATIHLLREMMAALGVLHESRSVTHGAIGPERLLVTPRGRLVITDYTLGLALERLQYTRQRLWRDFRIAMPAAAGPARFDRASDVVQVGHVALAMLIGRRLEENLRLKALVEGATEANAQGERKPLSDGLRSWLERATGADARKTFTSIQQANVALEQVVLKEKRFGVTPSALRALIGRFLDASVADQAPPPAEEPAPARTRAAAGSRRRPVRTAPSAMPAEAGEPLASAPAALEESEDPIVRQILTMSFEELSAPTASGTSEEAPAAADQAPAPAEIALPAPAAAEIAPAASAVEETVPPAPEVAIEPTPVPGCLTDGAVSPEATSAATTAVEEAPPTPPAAAEATPVVASASASRAGALALALRASVEPLPEEPAAADGAPTLAPPAGLAELAAEAFGLPADRMEEFEPIVVEAADTLSAAAAASLDDVASPAGQALVDHLAVSAPVGAVEASAASALADATEAAKPAAVGLEPPPAATTAAPIPVEEPTPIIAVEVAPAADALEHPLPATVETAETVLAPEPIGPPAVVEPAEPVETAPEPCAEAPVRVEAAGESVGRNAVGPAADAREHSLPATVETAETVLAPEPTGPPAVPIQAAAEATEVEARGTHSESFEPASAFAAARRDVRLLISSIRAKYFKNDSPGTTDSAAEAASPVMEAELPGDAADQTDTASDDAAWSVFEGAEEPSAAQVATSAEASVPTCAEAVVETPAEAVVETSAEAPAATSAEACVPTCAEAPVPTCAEASVPTCAEAPVPTCAEAFVPTCAEASVESSNLAAADAVGEAMGEEALETAAERIDSPAAEAASEPLPEPIAAPASADSDVLACEVVVADGLSATEADEGPSCIDPVLLVVVPGADDRGVETPGPSALEMAGSLLPSAAGAEASDALDEDSALAATDRQVGSAARAEQPELPSFDLLIDFVVGASAAPVAMTDIAPVAITAIEPPPEAPAEPTAEALETPRASEAGAAIDEEAATPPGAEASAQIVAVVAATTIEPIEAVEPVERVASFAAVEPVEPDASVESIEPVEPVASVESFEPAAPSAMTDIEPAAPAAVTGIAPVAIIAIEPLPETPAEPTAEALETPCASEAGTPTDEETATPLAAEASGWIEAVVAAATIEPVERVASFAAVEPVEPVVSVESLEPVEPVASVESLELVQPIEAVAARVEAVVVSIESEPDVRWLADRTAAVRPNDAGDETRVDLVRAEAEAAESEPAGGSVLLPFSRHELGTDAAVATGAAAATDAAASPEPGRRQRPRRPPIHWKQLAGIAAALVMVAFSGVQLATAYWLRVPLPNGSISIESAPPGLEVFIDGSLRGSTPVTVTLAEGTHALEVKGRGRSRALPIRIVAGARSVERLTWPAVVRTGSLRVESEPAGATVYLDGARKGVAPLVIDEVTARSHAVMVEGKGGRQERRVSVEPDTTTSVRIDLFPGWIQVASILHLEVREKGVHIGSTDIERIMLPSGPHLIELVNDEIGFHVTRDVQVHPGDVVKLAVEMPRGSIEVEAPAGLEVWLDGGKIGTTPLAPFEADAGTHNVRLTGPGTDQTHVAVVTLKAPAKVRIAQAER